MAIIDFVIDVYIKISLYIFVIYFYYIFLLYIFSLYMFLLYGLDE